MDPGPLPVPPQLQVSLKSSLLILKVYINFQGLTQVEEMLISAVLPIMSPYHLPHGHYGYSTHLMNLPQDVTTFAGKFLHVVYQ